MNKDLDNGVKWSAEGNFKGGPHGGHQFDGKTSFSGDGWQLGLDKDGGATGRDHRGHWDLHGRIGSGNDFGFNFGVHFGQGKPDYYFGFEIYGHHFGRRD